MTHLFAQKQLDELGFKLLAAGQTCGIDYATVIDPLSGIEFLLLSGDRNSTWFSKELCNKKKPTNSHKQQLVNLATQKLNQHIAHTKRRKSSAIAQYK
ncbi:MAG: hypothetical protein SW833_21325 [Cyanobacteriota bacterium]|nr:hypothetical protein [Cyanobacteriota bacterium]